MRHHYKPAVLAAISAIILLALAHTVNGDARGTRVAETPHNLSISGGGGAHDVKSALEARVCIYCHTPHHASSEEQTPLWSRGPSELTIEPDYTMYRSDTSIQVPDTRPRRSSRLCLSCHDGTIALGQLVGGYILDASLSQKMPTDIDPRKNANLGLDLSNDHPISLLYDETAELFDKSTLTAKGIKLSEGLYVECSTCHNAHNNQFGNFLVRDVSTQHDALCTDCHNKGGWNDLVDISVHRTGGSISGASQVAADGCISCHLPHSAQQGEELLKLSAAGAGMETNCYANCHNSSTYAVNIYDKFLAAYSHPIRDYPGKHSQKENKEIYLRLPLPADYKHVQCVDCHNPHRAGKDGVPLAAAPSISGALRGVSGVTLGGVTVTAQKEYEICFKCHSGTSAADFAGLSSQRPVRIYQTYQEELRFAVANPSAHPVIQDRQDIPGISGTGRSLISTYQGSMKRIYCIDCHDPHGSSEAHILTGGNYDNFPSSDGTASYPLCFRCHDKTYLLTSSASAALHTSHVSTHTDKASCSACHDPHGVSSVLGGTLANASHLINFDTRYAGAGSTYNSGAATCALQPGTVGTCHASSGSLPKRVFR